ncbi:MAG TPA: hypothetical protein VFW34_09385 [Candidatus Rubrimentiphilum sp.]|nr:hypothetical protein [Candidatus Rubrimentiphilum sp.]
MGEARWAVGSLGARKYVVTMSVEKTAEAAQKSEHESKLYENRARAEQALGRLEAIGYGHERISLIIDEHDLPVDQSFESDSSPLAERGGMGETGALAGAMEGGLIGAITAAAAGTLLVAEGVIVAGPLAPLVLAGVSAGVVGGTIIGGLLELGVEAEDWRAGLRRGGIVVVVALKTHADRAAVRKALMNWT